MVNTKIRKFFSPGRIVALVLLGLLIAVSRFVPSDAQAVAQGFDADQPLQRGMIVVVRTDAPTKVEAATQTRAEQMYGVVVDPNDTPVTLSRENQKILVVTAGQFEVLVSDQNGYLTAGDYVVISSVNGIGMKASSQHKTIVGKALAAFDASSEVIGTAEVKGDDKSQTVRMGRILVDISIGRNPLHQTESTLVPSFIQRAGDSVAGKPISVARLYLGLSVLLLSGLVAGGILYIGIRSSITAIGRNPLSRKSIIRGLVQVTLTSVVIFIIGVVGVYLLLKL